MGTFYSCIEKGFFDDSISSTLPADAKPISEQDRDLLISGESGGKVISWSTSPPTLIDRPAPTSEELAVAIRAKRDGYLSGLDRIMMRNSDELELGKTPTFSSNQIKQVIQLRDALRHVPQQAGFPESVTWPAIPEFVTFS